AAHESLTKKLMDKKVTAIAYETVQLSNNALPLLTPMSEVAGYMATQLGAQFLEKTKGGKGVLLAGIPGVKRGKVTIIGGGNVGTNAAKIAVGLGANVSIIDLSADRLRELDELFGSSVSTVMSNPLNIQNEIENSDLVIGAVLIPGAKAPTLVTEEMVKKMMPGSVILDVAIDQGGIFETADRITTHDDPTYEKHGVLHYAVSNMPGAVPRTSTIGLVNTKLHDVLQIAIKDFKGMFTNNQVLDKGINVHGGYVTIKGVADAHELSYKDISTLLN